MSRKVIDPVEMDRTTIYISKMLIDRFGIHVKTTGDNQTNFMTRAIVNQLEREGDFEIRLMLEEEKNNG